MFLDMHESNGALVGHSDRLKYGAFFTEAGCKFAAHLQECGTIDRGNNRCVGPRNGKGRESFWCLNRLEGWGRDRCCNGRRSWVRNRCCRHFR